MPSRPGPKISDWVSRLGIRDLYPPQRRIHHQACPSVEFMRTDIKTIVDTYYRLSVEAIKDSMEIRDASGALLDTYGPVIWSDEQQRPWLFSPGEGASDAPYPRHLYHSNVRDAEFLEKTLYGYVLARVLRWHKDHFRNSLSETPNLPPDASYEPSMRIVPRATRASGGGASTTVQVECIAAHSDHLDASHLLELGIWLGDYEEENRSVEGYATQNEVEARYFEQTLGGKECDGAEPYTIWKTTTSAETVVCAACSSAKKDSPSLRLETIDFSWINIDEPDDENRAEMQKLAWIFRCSLHGRDVFAFVKELTERECQKAGLRGRFWSFWQNDGGHTTEILLAKPSSDTSFPVLKSDLSGPGIKRKRVTNDMDDGEPGPSTVRTRISSNLRAFFGGRVSNNIQVPQSSEPESQPANGDDGSGYDKSSSAFQPINVPVNASTFPNGVRTGTISRVRRPSFNSLYDSTPRPKARDSQRPSATYSENASQSGAAVSAEHSRQSLNVEQDPRPDSKDRDEQRISMPPPPPPQSSFRIWYSFNMTGSAEIAAKAVRYNTSMTFEQASTHTSSKLTRQVGGRTLFGMTVNSKVDGRPSLLVDEDDMWEELLNMVQETGSEELTGTLDME